MRLATSDYLDILISFYFKFLSNVNNFTKSGKDDEPTIIFTDQNKGSVVIDVGTGNNDDYSNLMLLPGSPWAGQPCIPWIPGIYYNPTISALSLALSN